MLQTTAKQDAVVRELSLYEKGAILVAISERS